MNKLTFEKGASPSMGVRNLWKLLAPCGEKASIENKTLAIDTSIWMHQYKSMPASAVLYSIAKRIFKIIYNGAKPVFVFDGAAPGLKKSTLEQRKRDELRAVLRGIVCNKKCRMCGKILRECEHVNDLGETLFEEVSSAVSKRIAEHSYNWGELSGESSEEMDESVAIVTNEGSNQSTGCEEDKDLARGNDIPCQTHFQDESISSFRADSIRSLSKTRQLKRLIELRQKRKALMQYDNSNCDRFSQSQIENVRRRNMVSTMIRDLNDGAGRRVQSDWTIQSELKKDQNVEPVLTPGPSEELLECSAHVTKAEDVEIEDLFDGPRCGKEWIPVYEDYSEKKHAVFPGSVDSLIKTNSELAIEVQNKTLSCSTVPMDAKHLQLIDRSAHTWQKDASGSSSSASGGTQPSNLSSSEISNSCGSDDTDHQDMQILAELQECMVTQEGEFRDKPVGGGKAFENLLAGRVASSDFRRIQETIKDVLKIFGIPFVESPGEADSQCSHLFKKGLVDGVISEDNDMIVYGTTVYKNFFRRDRDIAVFTFQSVREKLGLCQDDMIKLSFLLGSDYCVGVRGIGIKKAMENIRNVREDEIGFLKQIYNNAQTKDVERLEFGKLDVVGFQKYLLKNGVEKDRIGELMIYCHKMREL